MLDEPFAGVDPISVADIKQIVSHLRERGIGVPLPITTLKTLDICEQAYIVGEGHIIASGSPQEVLNGPKVQEVYLGKDFRL